MWFNTAWEHRGLPRILSLLDFEAVYEWGHHRDLIWSIWQVCVLLCQKHICMFSVFENVQVTSFVAAVRYFPWRQLLYITWSEPPEAIITVLSSTPQVWKWQNILQLEFALNLFFFFYYFSYNILSHFPFPKPSQILSTSTTFPTPCFFWLSLENKQMNKEKPKKQIENLHKNTKQNIQAKEKRKFSFEW